MWQTTSEPLFIFPLLSFLSASPSFSFVMQPEKAVSSEIEKGSKRETDERGEKRWKDGDGVGMIVCEQVLMTSLLLTPLCLLSSLPPNMENIPLQIFLSKKVTLCRTLGKGLPCFTLEHNCSSSPVRVISQLGGGDDIFQFKCDCIYLPSKMWS